MMIEPSCVVLSNVCTTAVFPERLNLTASATTTLCINKATKKRIVCARMQYRTQQSEPRHPSTGFSGATFALFCKHSDMRPWSRCGPQAFLMWPQQVEVVVTYVYL